MATTRFLLAAAPSILLAATAAHGGVLPVPASYPSIQAAIDAASPGDEVVLAGGTYYEHINFNGKSITVRSTDPSNPAVVASTIIDGGDNGLVVMCGAGSGMALRGVTVTGGDNSAGGGMYVANASPTVSDCTFTGNTATSGGGIYLTSGANVTVTDCEFFGNVVSLNGGAISCEIGSVTVSECSFHDNSAKQGGAVYLKNSGSTIMLSTFVANAATNNGGAVHTLGNQPSLIDCTFQGNSANVGGAIMCNSGTTLTVDACSITENISNFPGGGIKVNSGVATLSETTVCGNSPDQISGSWTDAGGNTVGAECVAACPADVTGDGAVNGADLSVLLGGWGTRGPGDVDGNGIVDGADLAAMLGAWGSCD